MSIKKMSSQEYNKILSNAINKIEDISEKTRNIKDDMYTKVKIINHEQEYLNLLYEKSSFGIEQNDTFIFLNNGCNDGLYESYSNVVHAFFKQKPINIFNLKVTNGKESYFRDEVDVEINGVKDEFFKNILKANDVKGKEIFFEEYEFEKTISLTKDKHPIETINNHSTITISVDKNRVMGISKFNIIEIDPYLYKSFNIDAIEIYTDDLENPILTLNNIKEVGKTRFVLDKKYEFKKVVFKITHNYNTLVNGKNIFPFGIKHLFFLEADFRNDSYIIVNYKSDSFIDDIKDIVTVYTSTKSRESTLTEEGIKVFLSNTNGVLDDEQETSNDIKKPIARNLKEVFLQIPLRNEGIIGYSFMITKR